MRLMAWSRWCFVLGSSASFSDPAFCCSCSSPPVAWIKGTSCKAACSEEVRRKSFWSLRGQQRTRTLLVSSHLDGASAEDASGKNDSDDNDDDPLVRAMIELEFSQKERDKVLNELDRAGLWSSDGSSRALFSLMRDFLVEPEIISRVLITDFGTSPVTAHRTRAALLHKHWKTSNVEVKPVQVNGESSAQVRYSSATTSAPISKDACNEQPLRTESLPISGGQTQDDNNSASLSLPINGEAPEKKPLYKAVVVNEQAKRRKAVVARDDGTEYGLPRSCALQYPLLAAELDDFSTFMTQPSTDSQENPVRPATAEVYLRHAKLFLGWYVHEHNAVDPRELSIYNVIPTKEKESADSFISFLLWLRKTRHISVSYEANLLRGLTKLLKFRFRKDSTADPAYGDKSFDDIPVVRELRKLHREANKRQAVAPRSSEEGRKWLSWPEYLGVVQTTKQEVLALLEEHRASGEKDPPADDADGGAYSPMHRKIATAFQKYLILAIFANVPDRQRTIRELEIGRSFVKDGQSNTWCIKHAPEDYKTGDTYGERPSMYLPEVLTASIDDFIKRWRPCFRPKHNFLFCQVRTGNPLTQDSVYQSVARSCYKHTGKRTNPHLLRDMIVTHVRESSDASEQQLEALALYMGHSIQIQRASYDRRTLAKKVAPAVELMQHVNSDFS